MTFRQFELRIIGAIISTVAVRIYLRIFGGLQLIMWCKPPLPRKGADPPVPIVGSNWLGLARVRRRAPNNCRAQQWRWSNYLSVAAAQIQLRPSISIGCDCYCPLNAFRHNIGWVGVFSGRMSPNPTNQSILVELRNSLQVVWHWASFSAQKVGWSPSRKSQIFDCPVDRRQKTLHFTSMSSCPYNHFSNDVFCTISPEGRAPKKFNCLCCCCCARNHWKL